jgi:hypothetical protein
MEAMKKQSQTKPISRSPYLKRTGNREKILAVSTKSPYVIKTCSNKHIPLNLYLSLLWAVQLSHLIEDISVNYQDSNALLFITKWYNIGKKGLGFYVNLANTCTDITLKINENCT